jgi:uncharacterized protein (DUF302 family)
MTTNYGFTTSLNVPYEEAIEKTTAALKEEGFGVLTEIDVKATLKKKFHPQKEVGCGLPALHHFGSMQP